MKLLPVKSLVILFTAILLSGCFIRINPTPGGVVQNQSGNHPNCGVGDACEDIAVVDLTFDETFVAVPDEGYEFVRWISAREHFFGCTTEPSVRLYTADLEGTGLESYFSEDDVFFISPQFRSTGPDIDFSSDFECNDLKGEEIGEGWVTFINVFEADGSTYVGGYWVGPTPNAAFEGGQIAALAKGQGGKDQGRKQLNVFSNYDSAFNDVIQHEVGQLVEVNVYKEYRLTPENVGTYVFTFDARLPDEGALEAPATAKAFLKVLDPSNDFQPFGTPAESDAGTLTTDWETRSVEFTVTEEMDGMILQFGLTNMASNYDPTGVLYDNVDLSIKE
jgi:hypothetical protein